MIRRILHLVNPLRYLWDLYDKIKDNQILDYNEINLCGSRKSGKTISVLLFLYWVFLNCSKTRIIIMRKNISTLKPTIWTDWDEILKSLEISFVKSITYRTYWNGTNKLSFMGLPQNTQASKKVSLSGLGGLHVFKYVIIILEEATEFSQKDIEDIKEAVRTRGQVLYITMSNPSDIGAYIIERNESFLHYDEKIMKQENEMKACFDKKLFHYFNYPKNQFLSNADKEQLEEVKKLNPQRALWACYGVPTVSSDSIYGHALHKVSALIDKDLENFAGGIDYGYRNDATVLIITGADYGYSKLNVVSEWYHNNAKMIFKDNLTMAKEIVEHIIAFIEIHPVIKETSIVIYCDTSDYTFTEILKNIARERNIANYVFFRNTIKYEVKDRVSFQRALMESERLNVDLQCKNFYKELRMAHWEENKKGEKIADEFNDTQDAFHYSFCMWYRIMFKTLNQFLFDKN